MKKYFILFLFVLSNSLVLHSYVPWRLNDLNDRCAGQIIELEYLSVKRYDGGSLSMVPAINYFKRISRDSYLFMAYDYRSLSGAHVFADSAMPGNLVLGNYFRNVLQGVSVFAAVSLPDSDDTRGMGTDTIDFSVWGIYRKVLGRNLQFRGAAGFGIWGRSDLNNKSYLLDKDDLVLGERRLMFGPSSIHGTVDGASGQEDVIVYDGKIIWMLSNAELYAGIDGFTNGVFYKDISQWKIGLKGNFSKNKSFELMYSGHLASDSMKNSIMCRYEIQYR